MSPHGTGIMLQLINRTDFAAERAALVSSDGSQVWVIIIKATYRFDHAGSVHLHGQQEPVCLSPLYSGEPGRSSLLRDVETVVDHPGTDVTVLATARAPNEKPVSALDVGVRVAAVAKTIRVFGRRFWRKNGVGLRISAPEPFIAQPINYETAYGGIDVRSGQKESRNPIGVGFASSADDLNDKPLPNAEEPRQLINEWTDRPTPAGFGPIPPMWSPRLEYAGTFDSHWRELKMPLLPDDYDSRHARAAHPDLVSEAHLRGGEEVVLSNLTPVSTLRFLLPRVYLVVTTYTVAGSLRQRIQLDRVIIEPDIQKLVLVWRSSLNCGSHIRDVVRSVVELKPQFRRPGSPVETVGS